jgi:hypothetical protein
MTKCGGEERRKGKGNREAMFRLQEDEQENKVG